MVRGLSFTLLPVGKKDMSETLKIRLQNMTDEALIEFALEHFGSEHEAERLLVLQEHFERMKNDSDALSAPPGDIEFLKQKFNVLSE